MKKWLIIGIILLVVIIVSVYFYKKSKKTSSSKTTSNTSGRMMGSSSRLKVGDCWTEQRRDPSTGQWYTEKWCINKAGQAEIQA